MSEELDRALGWAIGEALVRSRNEGLPFGPGVTVRVEHSECGELVDVTVTGPPDQDGIQKEYVVSIKRDALEKRGSR